MDLMRTTLDAGLPALGLELSEETRQKLCDFGAAVVKQNEVMNLTAITAPDQVAKLHLLDSLSVLCCADLKGKTTWERAELLINIAHPDFRDQLIKDAERMGIWKNTSKLL